MKKNFINLDHKRINIRIHLINNKQLLRKQNHRKIKLKCKIKSKSKNNKNKIKSMNKNKNKSIKMTQKEL